MRRTGGKRAGTISHIEGIDDGSVSDWEATCTSKPGVLSGIGREHARVSGWLAYKLRSAGDEDTATAH
jgi:hypothetical protein